MSAMYNYFSNIGIDRMTTDGTAAARVFVVAVLTVVVIAGIIFWYLKPRANNALAIGPYVLRDPRKLDGSSKGGKPGGADPQWISVLTAEQAINTSANNITCSFFVYMDEVNRERIPIGSPDGDYRFQHLVTIGVPIGIMLDPIHQKLILDIAQAHVADANTAPKANIKRLVIENVMVAKWNQITVTVEGRTVDIYVNGILKTSTLLDNVAFSKFYGLMLNTSPDFSGQAGLFQMWPRRLTVSEISENYRRNTDTRGKPLIPDIQPTWRDILDGMKINICRNTGICGFGVQVAVSPLQYVNYEFA
jgi:hypothetical protein